MTGKNLTDMLLQDARDSWPSDFADIEATFNDCCFAVAVDVNRRLGLFCTKGETMTFDEAALKIGAFKDARYVLRQVLEILVEEKVLENRDGTYVCMEPDPEVETPAEALVAATRAFPGEAAPFQWLARAHDGLCRFIKGELFGEEIMFPWGDFKLAQEVYDTSSVYGFYPRFAGRAVAHVIEEYYDGPVSLIEIGAGTGNGTLNVLSRTTNFNRYLFTDISKALVQRTRRTLKKLGHEFFEYEELDIEKDQSGGPYAASADMVLAVNVLHATGDIRAAVANCTSLLVPGGWLILAEIAPPPEGLYRYMELTFGLLPSFSSYSDTQIRPKSAIVRPEIWEDAFRAAGLQDVAALPGGHLEGVDRGGIVIGRRA